jgi:hypothetical protein
VYDSVGGDVYDDVDSGYDDSEQDLDSIEQVAQRYDVEHGHIRSFLRSEEKVLDLRR